jgi:hypothetical protein
MLTQFTRDGGATDVEILVPPLFPPRKSVRSGQRVFDLRVPFLRISARVPGLIIVGLRDDAASCCCDWRTGYRQRVHASAVVAWQRPGTRTRRSSPSATTSRYCNASSAGSGSSPSEYRFDPNAALAPLWKALTDRESNRMNSPRPDPTNPDGRRPNSPMPEDSANFRAYVAAGERSPYGYSCHECVVIIHSGHLVWSGRKRPSKGVDLVVS